MEELQILVDMVAGLPSMAIWVLAGYLFYKVVVIGSIFGIIKMFINKLHSYLITPKDEIVNYKGMIDRITITGNEQNLMDQLKRIAGARTGMGSQYIHRHDIEWLEEAITEKIKSKGK